MLRTSIVSCAIEDSINKSKDLPGFEREKYEYVINFRGKCPKKYNLEKEITRILQGHGQIISTISIKTTKEIINNFKNLNVIISFEALDNINCLTYELIGLLIEDFAGSFDESSFNCQMAVY